MLLTLISASLTPVSATAYGSKTILGNCYWGSIYRTLAISSSLTKTPRTSYDELSLCNSIALIRTIPPYHPYHSYSPYTCQGLNKETNSQPAYKL